MDPVIGIGVGCVISWGAGKGWGPGHADTQHHRLVLGMWNITSLAGKEPELVQEVEQYQLDIVSLTSTHSTGSEIKPLERGWTLSFSRLAQGLRCRVGVGILHCCVGVLPSEREGRLYETASRR